MAAAPEHEHSPFREMISRRGLILVTGKGGTGKSTLVATLAALAARRHGTALAVEMSAHPRLPEMLGAASTVRTTNIDADRAVQSALARLLGLPELVTRVFNNRFLRMFIRTSPAIREMILLDELHHLVESHTREGRPVIVDLPASGHALSFLDTPRAVHRLLRVGPLAQIAARVEQLLLDGARCELVVVTLPEELPVNETIELVRRAQEIGLTHRTVVVNQVPAVALGPGDGELLEILRAQGDQVLGRFAAAAQGDLARADEAQRQMARLRAAVDDRVLELPLHRDADPQRCVAGLVEEVSR
jgi:anion-transporting  ArsA/GET3 family ATPase